MVRAKQDTDKWDGKSPAQLIDERIAELEDWRGHRLKRVRELVREADPDIVETWKYRGVPIWEHDGVVCTGETYKAHIKMTFPKGASMDDPAGMFNGTTGGSVWRAIDLHEDDPFDEDAFKALVRQAVERNTTEKAEKKAAKAAKK